MSKNYYLFKRSNGIYYAQILNPETGKSIKTLSTRSRNRDDAAIIVHGWLQNGFPVKKEEPPLDKILQSIETTQELNSNGIIKIIEVLQEKLRNCEFVTNSSVKSINFVQFLETFWNYEKSPYVAERHAHGYSLSKGHCENSLRNIQLYWAPYFQSRMLASITRQDLKDFSNFLSLPKEERKFIGRGGKLKKHIKSITAKTVLTSGITALRWAYQNDLIATNPCIGLLKYQCKSMKRGILTIEEAALLFKSEWDNHKVAIANLLACVSGLRAGEILALRAENMDYTKSILNITHSWNDYDKLKDGTKNGEPRRVSIPFMVMNELSRLIEENPHSKAGFIFYSDTLPEQPMDRKMLLKGLQKTLKKLNIDAKSRHICFHSWRHFYTARMADIKESDKVMRITGHKTKAVFNEYADHIEENNLIEMREAAESVFSNILLQLPFSKGIGLLAGIEWAAGRKEEPPTAP